MSVDKKINYEIQGGVKNYKPSEMVTVPKKAKSSPKHPATELAYITKAEKDLLIKKNLHGSLKGKVNKGPGGVMSLNGGFNEPGGFQSGGNQSAAESGDSGAFGGGAENQQNAQDVRNAAINAGAGQTVNPGFFDDKYTISPEEVAAAKTYRKDPNNLFAQKAFNKTHGGGLGSFISGGGIMGGLIRKVGQAFGLGKRYNEPTYDMSGYNSLGLGGTGQEGFGVPNFESGDGDYDMLGNKINEITGEITSPTGQSLGFLKGYPGQKEGIEAITPVNYSELVEQFLPESTMPEDEDLPGGFKSRFLQNRTQEEREAIEDMINEKFKYDYNSFGLGDMDGS